MVLSEKEKRITELQNLQFDTAAPSDRDGCLLLCYTSDDSKPDGIAMVSRELTVAIRFWMSNEMKINGNRAFEQCLLVGDGKIRFVPRQTLKTKQLVAALDRWKHEQLSRLSHNTPAPSYGRR